MSPRGAQAVLRVRVTLWPTGHGSFPLQSTMIPPSLSMVIQEIMLFLLMTQRQLLGEDIISGMISQKCWRSLRPEGKSRAICKVSSAETGPAQKYRNKHVQLVKTIRAFGSDFKKAK